MIGGGWVPLTDRGRAARHPAPSFVQFGVRPSGLVCCIRGGLRRLESVDRARVGDKKWASLKRPIPQSVIGAVDAGALGRLTRRDGAPTHLGAVRQVILATVVAHSHSGFDTLPR